MKVLDFAKEIDQSGLCFYEEMAMRAETPGVRRIFTMLAQDEQQLLQRLDTMKTQQAKVAKYDSSALNQGINAFEQLRRQMDQLEIHDDVAAYQLAMEAEQQVVRQYMLAARQETRPEVRHLLRDIATVEQHELEEIEQLYHFTNAPSEYLEWGEFSNTGEFHNFGRDVDI